MTRIKNLDDFMMIDETEMEALFMYNDSRRCLANTYEIYHDDETVISDTDDLYSVLNLGDRFNNSLTLNSNTVSQDGTVILLTYDFKIKAVNPGGAFGWKSVQFNLVICGWETMATNDNED